MLGQAGCPCSLCLATPPSSPLLTLHCSAGIHVKPCPCLLLPLSSYLSPGGEASEMATGASGGSGRGADPATPGINIITRGVFSDQSPGNIWVGRRRSCPQGVLPKTGGKWKCLVQNEFHLLYSCLANLDFLAGLKTTPFADLTWCGSNHGPAKPLSKTLR